MKKRHSARAVPLLSVLAISLAACGGAGSDASDSDEAAPADTDESVESESADDADDEPVEAADAPADDEPAADEPATDETVEEAPEVDEAATDAANADPVLPVVDEAPGDGASVATAAPLVGSQLAWTQGDAEWDLAFSGFVEVDRSNGSDGTCAALFGTATLSSVEGDAWNSATDQPKFGLLVGGEYVTPRNNGCSDDLNTSLGYRYNNRLNVVPGTGFPFVAQFRLDDIDIADVEAFVVGKEGADEQHFFQPTMLPAATDVPAATPTAGDVSALGVAPLGTAVSDTNNGQQDITVTGVVDAEASELAINDEGPGRCVSITHTITANTSGSEGRPVTSGVPTIAILAGGQLLAYRGADCVNGAAELAGFQNELSPRLTPGTSINRVMNIFVPDELDGGPAVVVIDSSVSLQSQLFEIDLGATTSEFPALSAPADASVLPASNGAMPAGPLSYDRGPDQTVWSVDIAGFIDGGADTDGTGQCWHLPMTLTASAEENLPPQLYAVSDGQANLSTGSKCLTEIMVDAGWESLTGLDFAAGVAVTGFATFNIPNDSAGTLQQLIVGVAPSDQPTIVLDATVLDAIPAP